MSALHQSRCFNHALREAVARCPSCKRFFCRECVTEHEDRLTCASCLGKSTRERTAGRGAGRLVLNLARGVAGFVVIWIGFYLLGQFLLQIPSDLHEDVLWREHWLDEL